MQGDDLPRRFPRVYEWPEHKIFLMWVSGSDLRPGEPQGPAEPWNAVQVSWSIVPQSIFKQSVLFCRPTPACFAWLSIPTKDSPYIRTGAPNCTAARGVAKCRRTSSPFPTELMSTCSPVRTITNESQRKHDERKWTKVASLEIDNCLRIKSLVRWSRPVLFLFVSKRNVLSFRWFLSIHALYVKSVCPRAPQTTRTSLCWSPVSLVPERLRTRRK